MACDGSLTLSISTSLSSRLTPTPAVLRFDLCGFCVYCLSQNGPQTYGRDCSVNSQLDTPPFFTAPINVKMTSKLRVDPTATITLTVRSSIVHLAPSCKTHFLPNVHNLSTHRHSSARLPRPSRLSTDTLRLLHGLQCEEPNYNP